MGRRDKEPDEAPAPFHAPFAGLKDRVGELPQQPAVSSPATPAKSPAPAAAKPGPARAVVRMERKGHGGKEVTVIEQLDLPARHLARWCKELKSALGCGGIVDGTAIVLQGDQRGRVKAQLEARGVRKISVG